MSESICNIHMYLKKHGEKQQLVHACFQPLRDPAVDSVAAVIVAYELSPTYSELQSHLDTISLYKPVCINDFAPADHFQPRMCTCIELLTEVLWVH